MYLQGAQVLQVHETHHFQRSLCIMTHRFRTLKIPIHFQLHQRNDLRIQFLRSIIPCHLHWVNHLPILHDIYIPLRHSHRFLSPQQHYSAHDLHNKSVQLKQISLLHAQTHSKKFHNNRIHLGKKVRQPHWVLHLSIILCRLPPSSQLHEVHMLYLYQQSCSLHSIYPNFSSSILHRDFQNQADWPPHIQIWNPQQCLFLMRQGYILFYSLLNSTYLVPYQ